MCRTSGSSTGGGGHIPFPGNQKLYTIQYVYNNINIIYVYCSGATRGAKSPIQNIPFWYRYKLSVGYFKLIVLKGGL